MKKSVKGYWFYGLSGSGKTFASQYLSKRIKKNVIIDGDLVRKYISSDLGYSKKERDKQISRIAGICNLIIESDKFPIASSAWMNKKIALKLKKDGVIVLKIDRNLEKIMDCHKTYSNKKNVVGIDIFYEKFKSTIILNSGDKKFYKILKSLII